MCDNLVSNLFLLFKPVYSRYYNTIRSLLFVPSACVFYLVLTSVSVASSGNLHRRLAAR